MKYRRYGAGRTLVLQHGFLGGSGYWVPQAAHFATKFDVIACDLPGFGGSGDEPAPDSIEGFAAALIAQLDALGVDRFSLIGHSMGGMVALQMALDHRHRIDKLILYGTAASGAVPGRFETIEDSLARLRADGLETTAARITATWFVSGSDSPFHDLCLQAGKGASMDAAVAGLRAISRWDARARLGEVSVPTLAICGDQDRSTPPDESYALWRGIGNARLCVVPDCAHNVHLEKPDLFNGIAADFLLSPG